MKFSELWLREWVNPAIDSDALANQITMAGLEVDGVEPVAGSFHGVVVGEVVECAQHPNADKLRVTKVNVGGDRLLDIVCGAPHDGLAGTEHALAGVRTHVVPYGAAVLLVSRMHPPVERVNVESLFCLQKLEAS